MNKMLGIPTITEEIETKMYKYKVRTILQSSNTAEEDWGGKGGGRKIAKKHKLNTSQQHDTVTRQTNLIPGLYIIKEILHKPGRLLFQFTLYCQGTVENTESNFGHHTKTDME